MAQLHLKDLHEYQRTTVDHMIRHDGSMLWLGLGLGKTVSTLTAFDILQQTGQSKSMLVVAPLRVCQLTWRQEAVKWSHTEHLSFSLMCGTEKKRQRALFRTADIYLVNYESLGWLALQLQHYFVDMGRPLPFDMLVFDEVSKVKRSVSKRFEAFAPIVKMFKRRTGLTASPCSNGLHDLWGQFFMIDGGARLGTDYSTFQSAFFYHTGEHNRGKWNPYADTKDMIVNRINDITIQMSADAYLDMPELNVVDVGITLPPKKMKQYTQLEKDFFIELDNGEQIEVFNRAALCNKLLQFSNGIVYNYPDPEDISVQEEEFIHDEKYKALNDIVTESGDEPILLAYNFASERREILKRYPKAECLTGVKEDEAIDIMQRFNNGQIKLLIAHPLCLHPSTEVLTEFRGWVKIVDVDVTDRVYDGVEFVNHSGCVYSGEKEVTTKFGITMTHKHRILINEEWVEAENVRDCENIREKALYTYTGNDQYLSEMLTLRGNRDNSSPEFSEAQQSEANPLRTLHQRNIPQYDRHADLADLERGERASERQDRPELCGSRNWFVRGMGRLQEFLSGYENRLSRSFNNRANKRERGLLENKLRVGDNVQTASQQAINAQIDISRGGSTSSGFVPYHRIESRNIDSPIEQRDERGSGGDGRGEINIQEKPQKSKVYDLVDCGKRHRFLIRNAEGDVFISHNSAGHGLNLQDACHIVVWFGLNYNLELYEQFIGRIDRQGQKRPVQCFRIICNDTMDLVVMDALAHKDKTQSAMREAIGRYRGKAVESAFVYDEPTINPAPPPPV